jgi:hypothetical protein
VDTMAIDTKAAAGKHTTAVGTMVADSPGLAVTTTMRRRWQPQKTQPAASDRHTVSNISGG